jgi:hypothetical protein
VHRSFASLCDRAYLPKMHVMHNSLLRHSSESFRLYILAMDVETHRLLDDMQLRNVEILPLAAFEVSMKMQPVKASRTRTEYFWTAASSLMEYLMPQMDGEGITYLDADLMFFSDPKVIFQEMGARSIAIVPHRFPQHKRHMERNGYFNVSLVSAKNTPVGQACIKRWASQCRDWCFYRNEEGKFADQKYLDTWPTDYPGEVCSISHIGINVAPWNVSQWHVTKGPYVDGVPIVFYHAHEFQNPTHLTNYVLRDSDREFIYKPYVAEWLEAHSRIAEAERQHYEAMHVLKAQAERA